MSYTSVEMVGEFLSDRSLPGPTVMDERLTLHGIEFVEFCSGPIEADSLLVKSVQQVRQTRQEVALSGGSASLGVGHIIPGSVAVASDSSLATVYTENVDYVIDYKAGSIAAKDGGAIAPSATLTVWHREFTAYSEGIDYDLDAGGGRMRRRAGGSIADGETVWLDYETRRASFDEGLIAAAVAEANGTIAREIDSSGDFGADPGLQAAATCRALAVIGRAAAMRALTVQGDDRVCEAWLKLVESFAAKASEHLAAFRPAASGPSSPAHS